MVVGVVVVVSASCWAQAAVSAVERMMAAVRGRTDVDGRTSPVLRPTIRLSRDHSQPLYNRRPLPETTLYFAYGALLDPDCMAKAAPGSRFLFTAHYPETRLVFADSPDHGAIPTLAKESGHTVWGGVFEVPSDAVDSLIAAERAEGRRPGFDQKAVDREGNKYDCLAFVAVQKPNGEQRPTPEYLESMVNGAKHWSLPAGWVMGLEDLAEDPLFT